jgi:hypothetical protein
MVVVALRAVSGRRVAALGCPVCEFFHTGNVKYSLDFLHNLDTRAMTDPGAILGEDF